MPPALPDTTLARFHAAVARVDALIERDATPHGKTPAEIRARAEMRLARMGQVLAHLGDPHLRVPVIHVTGTSGKGSTSTAIARILEAAGLKVGLHTSPYLQTPTEKLQLGDRLVSPDDFASLVDTVLASHDDWVTAGHDALTYGEIWVALVMVALAEARVDVGVIEVGAGGRFDLTNVVRPAVTAITSVGIDHVVTLGSTIPEIAWHKAGIIKPGAPVITAVTQPEALAEIDREAARAGVAVTRIVAGQDWELIASDLDGTTWRDHSPDGGGAIFPAQPGSYQAGNAAVAVATARAFAAGIGLDLTPDMIATGLRAARIPGRFEVVRTTGEPPVILDGAHNPQKVAALADGVRVLGDGGEAGGGLVVALGALEAKQIDEMAAHVVPVAAAIVATSPRVLAKAGAAAASLVETVQAAGFTGDIVIEPDPAAAVERALMLASGRKGGRVLVTGSLYLVGNVRGRWYPDDDVTVQQTPWPTIDRRSALRPVRGTPASPPGAWAGVDGH